MNCCQLVITLASPHLREEHARYAHLDRRIAAQRVPSIDPDEEVYWKVKRQQVLFAPSSLNSETLGLYSQIVSTIKSVGDWYNHSDAMTDYFCIAFYFEISVK